MKIFQVSKVVFSIFSLFAISSCACVCPGDFCNEGTQTSVNQTGSTTLSVGGTSDSGTAGELRSIHFDYKRTDPIQGDLAQLQTNIDWLKTNSKVKLIVEGHGDRVGSNGYNADLAKVRAENVKQLLESAGIDGSRLKVVSMGRLVPFANPTATSAYEISLDRRVNFVIDSLE